MQIKDDHMKNDQLKLGYNVQMGTENQFIVGFSGHQRAGDARCFIPHLEQLSAYGRPMPKRAIADSSYGSEENYTYCEKKKMVALIKYNTLDREQTKAWAKEIGRIENMTYDEELDEWICAKGEWLVFVYERKETTDNGYVTVKMDVSSYGLCRMPVSSDMRQRQRHENHPRFLEKSTTTARDP
jgi:Transposase DDE domain